MFLVDGKPHVASHFVLPCGYLASVHHWDRIGSLLRAIFRRMLFIPALRYVDDYFGPEGPACVSHLVQCVVRIVRALLGADAIADRK